jgi:nitric oxide reductase NorD protein
MSEFTNDSRRTRNLTLVEEGIRLSSEELLRQFHVATARLNHPLSPEKLGIWAKEGLDLAQYSPPDSLKTAREYFQVTPEVLGILPFPYFLDWVRRGKALCRDSPKLATAYFRASPRVLAMIPQGMVEVWLEMGPGLYKNTPESIALACDFFTAFPELLQNLNLVKIERFFLFLSSLAKTSYDLAVECLNSAHQVFAKIGEEERGLFLTVALTLVRLHPRESATYFMKGAEALANVAGGQQRRFLSLIEKVARRSARHTLSLLFDCSSTFKRIDSNQHSRLLSWSDTVLTMSAAAGIEFLRNCPDVLAEIGISGLERWFREGARLLKKDEKGGVTHFRLEFLNERGLEQFSVRVELDQVKELLLMYGHALAGHKIEIIPSEDLMASSPGEIYPSTLILDEHSVFLPTLMDRYDSEGENFAWYKVAVTHQAGHIEFGTFDFCFTKGATLFSNWRQWWPPAVTCGFTEVDKFLNLFDDRRLAARIFTLVEDARIDYLVKKRYAGIRTTYQRVQQDALSRRPAFTYLTSREAFIEILARLSLGDRFPITSTRPRDVIESASNIMKRIQSPQATVEDSAEAALRLYRIARAIPNKHAADGEWNMTGLDDAESDGADASRTQKHGGNAIVAESNIEVPCQESTQIEFRCHFHPEMFYLSPKPDDNPKQGMPSPALAHGNGAQISEVLQGRNLPSGLYVTELTAVTQAQERPLTRKGEITPVPETEQLSGEGSLDKEVQSFFYDEWDYHTCRYRPNWCRVREQVLAEDSTDFYEATLARYPQLVIHIRKQFEMIIPELFRKANRQYDGDELDYDAVIKAVVDRKVGQTPDERIYRKQRRTRRDVAAILLLDMSASTSSVIKDTNDEYPDWYLDLIEDSPRLTVPDTEVLPAKPRRTIDVLKESTVLMLDALEAVGDRYGVYGFSSHNRENVDILVIKDMDKEYSGTAKRRIGGISPRHGTRMGPVVRHAISKLEGCGTRTKILILVSDGYPQDEDYGQDESDIEYALQDTKMAFIEAKRKKIIPFCLTVDTAGYDYLQRICHDMDYEVVNNIESLPQRLTLLYKRLTS